MRGRREKVFGPGHQMPLDRNGKCRVQVYAAAWDRLHRQPGQRGGALGRATLAVLSVLVWQFHNARTGVCFPSYERIAEKTECACSTVAQAQGALSARSLRRRRDECADRCGRQLVVELDVARKGRRRR